MIVIKGGRVLDPVGGLDAKKDILISEGRVAKIEDEIVLSKEEQEEARIIDADGKIVVPGLIDLHVHLREPGFEWKETVETGTKAMAHGGYTGVCPMPNTNPATDSPERIEWLINKAKEVSPIHVYPVGAVTLGQNGCEGTDVKGMKQAGAMALSEDGKSVMNSAVYRRAMENAAANDMVVMAHCEDKNLVDGGCINKGPKSEELGVKGISNAVEDIITARDIFLAKETGAKLHLCHISTRDSVKMLELAKEEGVAVTGEACPHHFVLCDEDIVERDTNYKMNPPLRSRQDRDAMIDGLKRGVIDAISTDHAPHAAEEKAKDITNAPFGIIGSESAFALSWTYLVRTGVLTPLELIAKMSTNPARILGISDRAGAIGEGRPADISIFEVDTPYEIREDDIFSKSKNTPFIGKTVWGRTVCTICEGKVVYEA